MQEEHGPVPVADLRRPGQRRRRRYVGSVIQPHAFAVLRASEMRRPGSTARLQRYRQRQPVVLSAVRQRPFGRPSSSISGCDRLLSGVCRGDRGRYAPTGSVHVRRNRGVVARESRRAGQARKLEIFRHPGRFRAIHRVPGIYAARVCRAAQSAQRPRLQRHVLRGLSACLVRLSAGHPVDDGRYKPHHV